MSRVQIISDGTPVGTSVLVDGDELPTLGVDVQLHLDRPPTVVLVLGDVDLHLVTERSEVCGAPHPEVATVRCEEAPHLGVAHVGHGYVWRDER